MELVLWFTSFEYPEDSPPKRAIKRYWNSRHRCERNLHISPKNIPRSNRCAQVGEFVYDLGVGGHVWSVWPPRIPGGWVRGRRFQIAEELSSPTWLPLFHCQGGYLGTYILGMDFHLLMIYVIMNHTLGSLSGFSSWKSKIVPLIVFTDQFDCPNVRIL